MRPNKLLCLGSFLSAALLFAPFSGAQQKTTAVPQANMAYDVTRESVVQGTVVSYTANSSVAPIGPHAKIQTSSGVVDVHLGNASLMKKNDIFLAPGDSVKIVGESENFGNGPVFLARVLQKGSQTLTIRNIKGIPISPKEPAPANARTGLVGAR
jgi:hypothetical protein